MEVNFTDPRMVVGYHDCDRTVDERVLLGNGTLKASNTDDDWLGTGIFFWEHGPQRALEFGEWKHRRGEIGEPFVLGAYIHLGQCFDVTDTRATGALGRGYFLLEEELTSKGQPLPENRAAGSRDFDLVPRRLDCAVLNWTFSPPETAEKLHDTVRGVFPEGEPAFPGAKIHTQTHVRIAVRNPACNVGYVRPA